MNRDVLILYSQKDNIWKEHVEKHIEVVVKSGHDFKMDFWSESSTTTSQWYTQFEASLDLAGVIVLLLSRHLLNSGLIQSEKVLHRLKKKQEGGFPLFILLLSEWQGEELRWLKAIPTLPEDGKLLPDLNELDRENNLATLAEHISDALKIKTAVTEGILSFLELNAVGPIKQLQCEPGSRLNIITGDNAMGKTLLLESAWWVLSGIWSKHLLYPRKDAKSDEALIRFQLISKSGNKGNIEKSFFNWEKQQWPESELGPYSSALVVYSGSDGSFALWDPVTAKIPPPIGAKKHSSPLVFDREKVTEGIKEEIPGKTIRHLCNGLVADLVNWQRDPDSPFAVFAEILKELSRDSQEPLIPGQPASISGDSREFPSIQYPYGTVPFIHTAASVQRILSFAYMIVWSWKEHKKACAETRKDPYKNMVVLIDEVESHLHPQWQRVILPSLLKISNHLDKELNIQFLITTHSPLVLASLEPLFDEENDKLFHLMNISHDAVVLTEQMFSFHGRVDNWFTSETFGLKHARSVEAEEAIQHAKNLQMEKNPANEEIAMVHKRLVRVLGDCDTFWPRWISFTKQHGVGV